MLTDRQLAEVIRPRFAERVFDFERLAFEQLRRLGMRKDDLARLVCLGSSYVLPGVTRSPDPRRGVFGVIICPDHPTVAQQVRLDVWCTLDNPTSVLVVGVEIVTR
jgi:cell division ATPase FtsA